MSHYVMLHHMCIALNCTVSNFVELRRVVSNCGHSVSHRVVLCCIMLHCERLCSHCRCALTGSVPSIDCRCLALTHGAAGAWDCGANGRSIQVSRRTARRHPHNMQHLLAIGKYKAFTHPAAHQMAACSTATCHCEDQSAPLEST